MKYYKDTNNNPFAFEDDIFLDIPILDKDGKQTGTYKKSTEIIANVEAKHSTTLTSISPTSYNALVAIPFSEYIARKVQEINTACSTEITSGFTSTALTGGRTYQSQELDQLNLIGVVTGGTDDYFKCAKTVSGKLVWSYEMHTVAQLKQVLNDGKVHKQALLQKAGTLKANVDLAKTQADLDLIVW